MSRLDFIRGIVQPTITWLGFVALTVFLGYGLHADASWADRLLTAYLTMVSMAVGWWFRNRVVEDGKKPPGPSSG